MIKKIYRILPRSSKSIISKLNYLVSQKPKYIKNRIAAPFPNDAEGGVIISADFELGWAVRYSKHPKDPVEYGLRERKNIPIILKYLEQYNIPIVWSTVGHLFLEECKRGDHDWMKRIPHFDDHWQFTEGDWFDCDPYSNYKDDPAWYAPDLIKLILNSQVKHEIACHTFSHIDCSYKNCPTDVIDDELKASVEIAKKWGIDFKSITFPGGTAGNYEILKKYNINICRKRHLDYELAYPFMNSEGVIVTPTGPSISIGYPEWSKKYRLWRYKRTIDRAIATNTIAHFWFHPSQEEETFTEVLPDILKYCDLKRKQGKLWIGTMQQISEFITNEGVKLAVL